MSAGASDLLRLLNRELAQVVERVRPSLVRVLDGRNGTGAGAIWHPRGLIITNAHVAGNRGLRVVLADGRDLPARLVARDDRRDLAALMVEADALTSIPLGSSQALRPGRWVMALGHPWGVEGGVTAGVVIGAGERLPGLPVQGQEMVAVSLRLRPGHSGGLLLDQDGRLVGVNTMMAGPAVGLAVPIDVAKRFLKEALGSAGP